MHLCADQFKEVVGDKFNPDIEMVKKMLELGLLSLVVCKDGDVVCGYFMNLVTKSLLTSEIVAEEFALYIDPVYRGTSVFLRLMKATEQILISKGVVDQYITFMSGHKETMPLRLGFTPLELRYSKTIGSQ